MVFGVYCGSRACVRFSHGNRSGLVDDTLNSLTEDDLPSEIPSSDVALCELEECLRQHQQASGPHSGSDDPSDSA
jgi:hypothetical protein